MKGTGTDPETIEDLGGTLSPGGFPVD
jgi:hypothetical protein